MKFTFTPRSSPMRSTHAITSSQARRMLFSTMPRTSTFSTTRPGTTFMAPGSYSHTPTVATVPNSLSVRPARSTARMISAAAAIASRRRFIGQAPE